MGHVIGVNFGVYGFSPSGDYARKPIDVIPKPAAWLYRSLQHMPAELATASRTIQHEGHDWIRHRRITAPPLNERNNSTVWAESLHQAREMLAWWTRQDSFTINSTDKDVGTLALHVLIGAVFGIKCSFQSAMDPPDPTFTMTYRDALSFVLENFVLVLLDPSSILSLPWVPRKLGRIARVSNEFRRYMTHMLEKEKQMISQRAPGRGNLMSHLVRASEEEQSAVRDGEEAEDHMQASQGLSDSEIIGNIFLYTFAGHETTANMLSYSISLLAAHPEVQEWVAEEVHYVLQGQGTSETWEYSLFPRLKRCLTVMVSHSITMASFILYLTRVAAWLVGAMAEVC